MTRDPGRHDRLIGAACLIVCPAISAAFLGLVAVLCVSPGRGSGALAVGSLVAALTFVANIGAICLAAVAVHAHAQRRVHRVAKAMRPRTYIDQ